VIAIVKDIEQQREVEALGADRVLLIGFSARELVEAAEHAASISQLDAPGREESQ
jgi:hypothetical protein